MGEAGRRFRDRGEIVTSCDATTPPRSVTAFRQHLLCRHPPVASRGVMRRHDATTDGPHPRLKKKTLCGPWAIAKNRRVVVGGCLFLETALVARSRLWRPRSLYRSE